MSARTVLARITDATDRPREGLAVFFHAPAGHDHVVATADASGVIRPELQMGITYRVSVENAVIVDGVTFPAGTILLVQVPEGEGDAAGVEALVGTIDASRPALLDLIATLQAQVDELADRIAALEAGSEEPESPLRAGGRAAGTALLDLTATVQAQTDEVADGEGRP